jgi:hypothetical protein
VSNSAGPTAEFLIHPGGWDLLDAFFGERFTLDEHPYLYGLAATLRLRQSEAVRDLYLTSLLHFAWNLDRAMKLPTGSRLEIQPIDQETPLFIQRNRGADVLSGEGIRGRWQFAMAPGLFVEVASILVASLSRLIAFRTLHLLAHPGLEWLKSSDRVT